MAKNTVKLDDEVEIPVKKQSIEEVVEEAAVLRAQAAIEDDTVQKEIEAEAKIPEVEIDLNEEREKTKREAIEAVTKDVIEPLKQQIINLQETLSPTEKDDYDTFVDEYAAKNGGKAPEWKEVAMFLEDRAVKRVKDEQKTQVELAKQAESQAKAQQEAVANENFKIWQSQLEDMESKEMLPKMEKPVVGDAGFDARVQLYGHMQGTWKTQAPSTNLWEVYAKFYKPQSKQPAGADAPVSMGDSGGMEDESKEYTYAEIHNGGRNLETFIQKELAKVGMK